MSLYYHCHSCSSDIHIQEDKNEQKTIVCIYCGEYQAQLKGQTFKIGFQGLTTDFNAHFDITQGKFFSSYEEKKDWLKKKNKEQIGGDFNPRKSGKGRFHCTSSQAKKFFAGKTLKKYIKNEDLHNKKIQVGWTRARG